MFSPLVNWLLVILAGLFAAVVGVMAATVLLMMPERWGMIAAWLGSGIAGYIGFIVYRVSAVDWSN